MKLYPNLSVEFTIQDCGSVWIGILRGPTDEIELTFNGIYNHKGCNGKLEYRDNNQVTATFWTSPEKMRVFFQNRFMLNHCMSKPDNYSASYAARNLATLTQDSETFLSFRQEQIRYALEFYHCGTISAERPDYNMQEAFYGANA